MFRQVHRADLIQVGLPGFHLFQVFQLAAMLLQWALIITIIVEMLQVMLQFGVLIKKGIRALIRVSQ